MERGSIEDRERFVVGCRCSVVVKTEPEVCWCNGTVRFAGLTRFDEREKRFWIGVELDYPKGKNGGTVNGTYYFKCQPECGIFVSPTFARLLDEEPKKDTTKKTRERTSSSDLLKDDWYVEMFASEIKALEEARAKFSKQVTPTLEKKTTSMSKLGARQREVLSSLTKSMASGLVRIANEERTGREVTWDLDEEHDNCHACSLRFNLLWRRHHCRMCGHIFCSRCAPRSKMRPIPMKGYYHPVRHCVRCFHAFDKGLDVNDLRHALQRRENEIERLKEDYLASPKPESLAKLQDTFLRASSAAKKISEDDYERILSNMEQFFASDYVKRVLRNSMERVRSINTRMGE